MVEGKGKKGLGRGTTLLRPCPLASKRSVAGADPWTALQLLARSGVASKKGFKEVANDLRLVKSGIIYVTYAF